MKTHSDQDKINKSQANANQSYFNGKDGNENSIAKPGGISLKPPPYSVTQANSNKGKSKKNNFKKDEGREVQNEQSIANSIDPPTNPNNNTSNKDEYIGREVNIKGKVSAENGIRLHATPTTYDKDYQSKSGISKRIYNREDEVTIIAKANEENEGWILIKTSDGKEGWIEHYFIKENKLEPLEPFIKQSFVVSKKGQGLEDIIEQVYYNEYNIQIGNDFYDIAKAIAILNVDNSGVYFTNGDDPLSFFKNAFDPARADVRKNYQSIRLQYGATIKLPTKGYIDMLRNTGGVGTRSETANIAIEFGRGSAGLLEGLATGFVKQAVESVTDAWDMIKGIFTGELWEQFKELYDFFKDLTWEKAKELFSAFATDFEKKWNQKNVFEKWKFRGEIVGRVLFEIVLAVFTGGAGLLKNVAKLKSVQKMLSKTQKLAAKLKKGVSKPLNGKTPDKDSLEKIFSKPKKEKTNREIQDENIDKGHKKDLLNNEIASADKDLGKVDSGLNVKLDLSSTEFGIKLTKIIYLHIKQGTKTLDEIILDARKYNSNLTKQQIKEAYDAAKQIKTYKERFKYTKFTDDELAERLLSGNYIINKKTGLFNKIGGRREFDRKADVLDVDGDMKMMKPDYGKFTKLKKERKNLLDKGDKASKQKAKIISELIGLKAADDYMKKLGYKRKSPMGDLKNHAPGKKGEFDLIYEKDGKFAIVEAKGGSGSLGGKETVEGFVQQGTKPYLDALLKKLEDKNPALALDIQEAGVKNIDYFFARQGFKNDGSLSDFIIKKFKL